MGILHFLEWVFIAIAGVMLVAFVLANLALSWLREHYGEDDN
jgi:hypothetical protein